ncbi:nitrite reductase small subunit NirD [uncultured Nitratireductor sp.]|uniref:nitrite reductase small subunit NirD n=1 Tax=uncultured Nitratireductor sp. TaxID=520953 RepID=UPI0025DB8A7E|nr:nitrite reductase small subunit NirD [uncultured Nitratireductor sp.]
MSASEREWVAVGTLLDIPRRGARCVQSGVMTIAVFRTDDDRVFALEDKCPHRAGPLSQGIVHEGCVTCPLHNWVISLETGVAQGADVGATAAFPVRLDGERILLALPDRAAQTQRSDGSGLPVDGCRHG